MKILHLNTYDIAGGAARAAYRLHRALLAAGVGSRMLVRFKDSCDTEVIGASGKTLALARRFLEKLPARLYPRRRQMVFSPAWLAFSGIARAVNRTDADLVHLHWLCRGLLRIEDLAAIRKPMVWSLHDMWAFTGGCHYDQDCGKYKQACGACPVLGSKRGNDLSSLVFRRKQKCFTQLNLTVVGLSRWLTDCAAASTLLRDKRIVNLPNLLETEVFRPMDKIEARQQLGLPLDRKIILFGAAGGADDPNKGFSELAQALKKIGTANVGLAVFGGGRPRYQPDLRIPQYFLGHLNCDDDLRALYCAADVMVVPSRQENLSNCIMEALASGTPVAAFNIGGNGDMIDHQINGYLARAYDPADLAQGIDWVLAHPQPEVLSRHARQKVLDNFDSPIIARKYLQLYQDVIESARR